MSYIPIWRYLSLAKYVDLLRRRSLYFPKASRFRDETEGKWWGQAKLYQNAVRLSQLPNNIQILDRLVGRTGDDPEAMHRAINQDLFSVNQWVGNILRTALRIR